MLGCEWYTPLLARSVNTRLPLCDDWVDLLDVTSRRSVAMAGRLVVEVGWRRCCLETAGSEWPVTSRISTPHIGDPDVIYTRHRNISLIHTRWKVPPTRHTNPGTSVHNISTAHLQTCCYRRPSYSVFRLSATKPTRSGRHDHLPVRFTPISIKNSGGPDVGAFHRNLPQVTKFGIEVTTRLPR
jgi:hypothetical protein